MKNRPLALAAALSVVVGVLYVVLIARHQPLAGDEIDYDTYGRLALEGKWLWLDKPYGVEHPSAWKPPGYPLWVGFWYTLLGPHPARVEFVQVLLAGPATVILTYVLAQRFSDHPRVPIIAAFVVALYPMAWQYTGLLYPEALAIPLGLALLVAGLAVEPTPKRAALVGVLAAANLLVRPTASFLLVGVLVSWLLLAGLRRTAVTTAITVAVLALAVAPWLIRNHDVTGSPIFSVQDAAVAGTFNPTSAGDDEFPYAWRPVVKRDLDLFDPQKPLEDDELRSRLVARAREYIADHPESLPAAFFWNGLSRLWDVRRPGHATLEAPFEGRTKGIAGVALACYYVLLVLALIGLWRLRSRKSLFAGIVAAAISASLIFTVAGGTRYRVPLEPVIAILAVTTVARRL